LKVQEYIKNNGVDALSLNFGIKVKQYDEGLIVLNYDQINSPKSDPVVIECRGLILYSDNFEVAARAFDRFFNYGEVPELTKSISFSDCHVYEKADGSLIKIYWCRTTGRWEISTRGTAFAESGNEMLPTFRSGVLGAFPVS
jgi:tRNA splicing ligase